MRFHSRKQRDGSHFNVALVGAGHIADSHLRALKQLSDVTVVGICDIDRNRAQAARQRWGLRYSGQTLSEIRDRTTIDVVHVLVPATFHYEIALECIKAGCHVFLEKPATVTMYELQALRTAAQHSGLRIGVNHNAVFHPAFRATLRTIQANKLGEIHHVTICRTVPVRRFGTQERSEWIFQAPGNLILEIAPHPFSQLHFLLGRGESVTTHTSAPFPLMSGAWFIDTWQVSLKCERGTAQCHLSFGKEFSESWLHVIGETGAAFVDLRRNTIQLTRETELIAAVDDLYHGITAGSSLLGQALRNFSQRALGKLWLGTSSGPFQSSMTGSISAFYEALTNRQDAPMGLDAANEVLETCHLIIEGLE